MKKSRTRARTAAPTVGDLQKLTFSAPLTAGLIDDDGVGRSHLRSRCGAAVGWPFQQRRPRSGSEM